jgi:hypothetical protein
MKPLPEFVKVGLKNSASLNAKYDATPETPHRLAHALRP